MEHYFLTEVSFAQAEQQSRIIRKECRPEARKDPDQFMQLHGRKCIIHTEKSIAKAAEDCNVL
ncbi:hypothetical protein TELCIR_12882 [Teladorsagia circumcincta]|uniref:Uncharacterized protein n=1 Tax=Teladorsagia circumcincta TaxID=45464 RepID=A0A2G9U5L0_TELCI|nr:hypothetical protein TELCIR_12882 [Teladorsagia circumcincta]